ncbi:MAG: hypothetical protein U0X91_03160 [Spirosomataceae bacterium]
MLSDKNNQLPGHINPSAGEIAGIGSRDEVKADAAGRFVVPNVTKADPASSSKY